VLTRAPEAVGASLAERHYQLFGLSLALTARPDLLSAMDARLKPFAAWPEQRADLRFEFSAGAPERAQRPDDSLLRAVYEPPDLHIYCSPPQPQANHQSRTLGDRIRQ